MSPTGPSASSVPPFEGFLAGGKAIGLPAQLFTELLPLIEDEAELRVTLYTLFAIKRRQRGLRAVRGSELAAERPLLEALRCCGGTAALAPALTGAVARGALLSAPLEDGDALYFANDEAGRRERMRVLAGAVRLPEGPLATPPQEAAPAASPGRIYEQEIGALTPGVAEALAAAAEQYHEDWIADALRLAARHNARSWAYAEAILRRWESEGRGGEDGEASDATAGTDPRAATRRDHGPYERVIRRS